MAEWIEQDILDISGQRIGKVYQCSHCKILSNGMWNYCPDCESIMDNG